MKSFHVHLTVSRLLSFCLAVGFVAPVFAGVQTVSLSTSDGSANYSSLVTAMGDGGTVADPLVIQLSAGTFPVTITEAGFIRHYVGTPIQGLRLPAYTTIQGSAVPALNRTSPNSGGTKLVFTVTPIVQTAADPANNIAQKDADPHPNYYSIVVAGNNVGLKNIFIAANSLNGYQDPNNTGYGQGVGTTVLLVGAQPIANNLLQCLNFTMTGVDIDGAINQNHGIMVGNNCSPKDVTIDNCLFTYCFTGILTLDFFRGNAEVWKITNCGFYYNSGDEIELNAPAVYSPGPGGGGTWTNVEIKGCSFKNSRYEVFYSAQATGGFGVGLSGVVTNAVVKNNVFDGYKRDAIHIENGCNESTIADNIITNCHLGMRISAFNNNTRNIRISGNTFTGVVGLTSSLPSVSRTDWGIQLVDVPNMLAVPDAHDPNITRDFLNNYPINIDVTGNTISNYDIGIVSARSSDNSLIAGNTISTCWVGINGLPALSIKDNILSSCTYGYQLAVTSANICGWNALLNCTTVFDTNGFTNTTAFAANLQSDFNSDGKADIVASNSSSGDRSLWLMNGINYSSSSTLGTFPPEWTVATTGDFNSDGKADIVWSNSVTGERALWLMNGTQFLSASTLGVFPLEWTAVATGDFNGDGKTDIVWSNGITGERALWLMNGTQYLTASTLGVFGLEWKVAAADDFDLDGKIDLVWSNSTTGEHAFWFMNGTVLKQSPAVGISSLGIFPLAWTVVGSGDFNHDGASDLVWLNNSTGERAFWFMNGAQQLSASASNPSVTPAFGPTPYSYSASLTVKN